MAGTEYNDAIHYALFKGQGAIRTGNSFEVRWSEITLAALRSAGFLDNMVDGTVPPTIDKLWLDKNSDPAVLKEWNAIGSNWEKVTSATLFGRVPWRGAWQSSSTYRTADVVSYNGSIWIAVQPSQNQTPAENAYWDLFLSSLADDSVTNAKLADMASGTIKGRASAGTGNPEDLTAADARKVLQAAGRVTSRAALKALDPAKDTAVVVQDNQRTGLFVWMAGNYAARIAADPLEAVFIKADSVAATSGAWVLQFRGPLTPYMFTAAGDGEANDAPAIQAMINLMMFMKWDGYIPAANFLCNSALTHTFTPSATGPSDNKNTFGCFRIGGAGHGLARLIFPDSDGIVLNAHSFQHTFDLTGFSLLAGSEGTRTGLKVRNTFAYFGEYNDKNNFDIDLRGSDGMGNQKFWGTAIDLFNVSKVKGRGSISGTVRAATDTNDSNYKSFGVGLRLASDPDPDSNPSTPNSTEPGYGTQYDIVMNFDLMGLSVEIGKGIQDVSFGPGTKMLIGYAGLEVLPGVTEVRQINLTGVTISGKGNGVRLRSGVSAFSLIGGYIGFPAGKNGIIFETNTGASNGAASHVKGVEFNADTAGASDAVYVNTNFNSIIIDANGYNGMNTAVELTANAGGVVIGDNSGYTNVNNKVIDGSAARANQVPAKLDFGTVTQLTSKTTAVTLNKRSGIITTNSAALAAGASASFTFNNSRYKAGDAVIVTTRNNANYSVRAGGSADGVITVTVKNETGGALGDPVFIDFVLQPAS